MQYSAAKFVTRIVNTRLKHNSFLKDLRHNRLFAIVPFSSCSPEFVTEMQLKGNQEFTVGNLKISMAAMNSRFIIIVRKSDV